MSIELPEAQILAKQMREVLIGKQASSYDLKDYERMQRIGFINKDLTQYERLIDGKIVSIPQRGNTIILKLDNGMNLILGPEYGGRIRYHKSKNDIIEKYHLKIIFNDESALTVRQTNMGVIQAYDDESLPTSYMFKRDFSDTLSPVEENFTLEAFSNLLSKYNRGLKSVLVGKDAIIVGISNASFQDIIYRAKLYPKRKASSLNKEEITLLFNSIKNIIQERLEKNGKTKFTDIYGNNGKYIPLMGPNMKEKTCPNCGTQIQKMNLGGGQTYYCPKCQQETNT
jgi:formamidopyrimidine-DNA glycosylase